MAKKVFETATNSYTEVGVIGNGGAGIVYRVEDSEEIYALKLLKSSDRTKLKRFKNELNFCRQNHHERIIRVVDEGAYLAKDVEQPFYVMPYYQGSLRTAIEAGIRPDAALRMFLEHPRRRRGRALGGSVSPRLEAGKFAFG